MIELLSVEERTNLRKRIAYRWPLIVKNFPIYGAAEDLMQDERELGVPMPWVLFLNYPLNITLS